MPRSRCGVACLVWLALCAPGLSADSYREIVALYRTGEGEGALERLAALSREAQREGLEALLMEAQAGPPPSGPAAALLHTDRALRERESGNRDGERFQLELARRLVRALAAWPSSARVAREWYLAAAEAWKHGQDWNPARELLDEGLEAEPGDAELLIARATLEEVSAVFTETREEPVRPRLSNQQAAIRERLKQGSEARQSLLEARELLRRALAGAPAHDAARLRYGRVLLELGETGAGLATLEPLRLAARDARCGHMAWLLYGGQLERDGRLDEAIEAYRAAVARVPQGQKARLALAHALDRAGSAEAGEALVAALAATPTRSGVEDPWTAYLFERRDLLDTLRRQVRR